MRTIIAGSRTITNPWVIDVAVHDSCFYITEVVSGCARGVDLLGEKWARANQLPVRRFPADWKKHGRAAGAIRNCAMANYAQALIAIWDGKSRGTKHMIDNAKARRLKVYVHSARQS